MEKLATKPHRVAYTTDYYAWVQDQVALLRARKLVDLDAENLAEELSSLGNAAKREIESRLLVLLQHLLKWQFQPEQRSNSWRATIIEQRTRIDREIVDSPSLRDYPAEVLADEYRIARLRAAGETGLHAERFPESCPYTASQALDRDFWPGGDA
jgi:hypothetical protein